MLVFAEPAAAVRTGSAAELLGEAGTILSRAEVGDGVRNLSIQVIPGVNNNQDY